MPHDSKSDFFRILQVISSLGAIILAFSLQIKLSMVSGQLSTLEVNFSNCHQSQKALYTSYNLPTK